MKKKIFIFLYLFLVSFPAIGKSNVIYLTKESVIEYTGRTIYIGGGMTAEVVEIFVTLDPKRFDRVSLHSWGGTMDHALKLATFINKNGLDTHVGKERACFSGCTIVYQAGITRTAHKSARFMYHYAQKSFKDRSVYDIGTHLLFSALRSFGISEDLLKEMPEDGGKLRLMAEHTMKYNIVEKLK